MMNKFTFTEVRNRKKGSINPVIVEFQNGEVVEKKLKDLKVKLTPYEQLADKSLKVTSLDGQVFTNNKVSNLSPKCEFIAIKNKKTNKIRLIEVEFTTLINSLFLKTEETETVKKDYEDQNAFLKKKFGSKKAIRQLKHFDFKIDSSFMDDQVNNIVEETKVSEISFKDIHEDGLTSLAPPCNRGAKSVSDVYKIEDCISNEELSLLIEKANEISVADNLKEEFSEFFLTCLKEATKIEENLNLRIACLLYVECLITYLKVPLKDLRKMTSKLCPFSTSVSNKIIEKFAMKSGSTLHRPMTMRDKTVCFIIVLLLIVCNYRLDLEMLSKQLAFGLKKLTQLSRALGVVPESRGSNTFVLKLPLPPPLKLAKSYNKKK